MVVEAVDAAKDTITMTMVGPTGETIIETIVISEEAEMIDAVTVETPMTVEVVGRGRSLLLSNHTNETTSSLA